jgi:hypothetical protein
MRFARFVIVSILSAALVAMPAVAEAWTRFRGANGDGLSSSTSLPTEFGPDTNKLCGWPTCRSDVPRRSSRAIASI